MANILRELTFDDWVAHIFDHEATGPEWYFDVDCDYWNGPAAVTVEYITRLFRDPLPHMAPYSDEQLRQGLWYLASNGASDMMFALLDDTVPLQTRVDCIRSFYDLFSKLFAPKCSPHLSHLDERGANPINVVCYMWWDLCPVAGTVGDPAGEVLNSAVLDVMAQTLDLDSIACQESALHGLGHWKSAYPARNHEIIDSFLARHPAIRPELRSYANQARNGCML